MASLIRTLLVDDEEPARDRLRRLLQAFGDVEVVGEAQDGEQAMERIAELRPDLVLLDIQMPGCSGTEVAACLPTPRPRIIFCTAYDEYAVDAFELNAVDYLLKPVKRTRLEKALERVRGTAPDRDAAALDGIGYPMRFLGKRGARWSVISRRDVLYFAAEGGQTKLQAAGRHYWMQPTLGELERRLDPACFFRISRSVIVSLDAVSEIQHQTGGYGEIELSDGSRVEVSRRRFKALLDRLKG